MSNTSPWSLKEVNQSSGTVQLLDPTQFQPSTSQVSSSTQESPFLNGERHFLNNAESDPSQFVGKSQTQTSAHDGSQLLTPVANHQDPNLVPQPHNSTGTVVNSWNYNWASNNVGSAENLTPTYDSHQGQWYDPNQFTQQHQWNPNQNQQYQDWNQQGQSWSQDPNQLQQLSTNEAQNYQNWQQHQYQDWPTYNVHQNQTEPQVQPTLNHEQGQGQQVTGIIEEHHQDYGDQLDYVHQPVLLGNQQVSQNIATSDSYQPSFHADGETASLASSADVSDGHSLSISGASQENQEFNTYNKSLISPQVDEQIDRQNSTEVSQDSGSQHLTHHQFAAPLQLDSPGTDIPQSDLRNENVANTTLSSSDVLYTSPQVDNSVDGFSDSGAAVVGRSTVQVYADPSPVTETTKDDGNYQYMSRSEQPVSDTCSPNHFIPTTTDFREQILDSSNNIHQLSAQVQSLSLKENSIDRVDIDANNIRLSGDHSEHSKPGLSGYESSSHMPLSERHISQLPGSSEAQSAHSNPSSQISDDWELVPPQIQLSEERRNDQVIKQIQLPEECHIDQVPTQSNIHLIPGVQIDQSFSSTLGNISPSCQNTQDSRQGPLSVTHAMPKDQTGCTPRVNFPDMSNLKAAGVDLSEVKNTFPTPPVQGSVNEGTNPFRKNSPNMSRKQTEIVNTSDPIGMPSIPFLTLLPQDQVKNSINVSGETSEFGSQGAVEIEESVNFDGVTSVHENVNSKSSHASSTPTETHIAKIGPESQNPILPRKESPFQPPIVRHSRSADNPKFSDSKSNPNSADSKRKQYDEVKKSVIAEKYDTPSRKKYSPSLGHDSRSRVHERTGKPVLTGKYGSSTDKIISKPPTGTSKLSHMSPKRLQSSLHENRTNQNMSPATTLWANPELSVPNILLAPAASLPALSILTPTLSTPTSTAPSELKPIVSLISRLDQQIKESSPELQIKGRILKDNGQTSEAPLAKNDMQQENIKQNSEFNYRSRSSSPEKVPHDRRDRRYENRSRSQSREGSLEREYLDDYHQGSKAGERYRDEKYYNRPTSHSGYGQESNRFPKDPYRDRYLDRSNEPDKQYGRPSSRQSAGESPERRRELEGERPQTGSEYDRDYYCRDRDRYREYEYDYYGRPYYNYDSRYGQYDYYPESRYSQGYYDELGYYHRPRYHDSRPPQSASQYAAGYDAYEGRSQHSHSGAHTPGSISDGGENDQPYQYDRDNQYKRYGSRPSSRHGYEDPQYYSKAEYDYYYNRGYDTDPRTWPEKESSGGRMTPAKFSYPHVCARFGPSGQLIKIQPNRPTEGQPAIVEVHNLEDMLGDLEEVEELKNFPGPLVREDTYKNDVLLFCQKKARVCSENMSLTDRESCELIWRLLELLIKQNGTVVGTDIADLLLEGHEPSTREYTLSGMKISHSLDNLDVEDESVSEAGSTSEGGDRTVVHRGRSQEETTDRFRHLLLSGRKKDALDWAMKNYLWGHALFLASKMDNRTHSNIMMKFANNAMRLNDPLQTLYQLMSGRQPAAVTCIADVKWGDWRPHLAMVLSNRSSRPELDRKSIALMGDTLAAKGYLHASHFCYLMAQLSFGSFNKKASKIVLIGSNHTLQLEEFATNEAIQCTEVYEYAMSLGNAGYVLGNFQYFKFLYACRMAEYGHLQEALHYCEIISNYIQRTPGFYQPTLVRQVYELGNRLKYFDAERMQNSEDAEDPMWLQQLQRIMQGLEDGSILPLSGTVTPMEYGTGNSSECGEVDGLMSGTETSHSYYQSSTISHALNQSQLTEDQSQYEQCQTQQYQPNQTQNQFDQSQYQNMSQQLQCPNDSSQYQYDQSQYQGQPVDQSLHDQAQYQQDPSQLLYQQPQYALDSSQSVVDGAAVQSHNSTMAYGISGQQNFSGHQQQGYNYKTATETNVDSGSLSHDVPGGQPPPPVQRQTSHTSTSSRHSHDSKGEGNNILSNSFDYFGAATHQRIVAPRLRKRTPSESSTGSVNSHGGSSSRQPPSSMASNPIPEKKETNNKTKKQTKSWFGIFNWAKSKNEMKLPDDKNPAIVWDPVNKRWENTDGDEVSETTKLPPPKDHELSEPSVPAMTHSTGQDLAPLPSNRFSRPKGRGLRSQYVDVMNPKPASSASVPSSLFNVLPTSASSPAIYHPGGNGTPEMASHQPTPSAHSNELNPKHCDNLPLVKPDTVSKLQSAESTATDDAPEEPAAQSSLPAMFNPAQFQSNQTYSQPTTGPKRYGQRRVYPK